MLQTVLLRMKPNFVISYLLLLNLLLLGSPCQAQTQSIKTLDTTDDVPNITFTITDDLGYDEDDEEIEDVDVKMILAAAKENTVIQIDFGYGKEDFTFPTTEPVTLNKNVDAGETVKIYGELTLFDISGNKVVTALSLGSNPLLKVLRIAQNKIAALDVSQLTELKELSITDNKITDIDLTSLKKLEEFYGAWNPYTTLDVTQNEKLNLLTCYHTGIQSLDLSGNPLLESLTAGENTYKDALNFTHNPLLRMLDLESSKLTSLDLTPLKKLEKALLYDNQLESLDVSQNLVLKHLNVVANRLDAYALNSLFLNLPKSDAAIEEKPIVKIARNPGAEGSETHLVNFIGWQTDVEGNGSGTERVMFRFEDTENGDFRMKVNGEEIAQQTWIDKGSEVEIVTNAMEGYELQSVALNGKTLDKLPFVASQCGYLTAVFAKQTTGVEAITKTPVKVSKQGNNTLIEGLIANDTYYIYDGNGVMIYTGKVSAQGTIVLPSLSGLLMVKTSKTVVKVLR